MLGGRLNFYTGSTVLCISAICENGSFVRLCKSETWMSALA